LQWARGKIGSTITFCRVSVEEWIVYDKNLLGLCKNEEIKISLTIAKKFFNNCTPGGAPKIHQ
jgi:hypothetical protein